MLKKTTPSFVKKIFQGVICIGTYALMRSVILLSALMFFLLFSFFIYDMAYFYKKPLWENPNDASIRHVVDNKETALEKLIVEIKPGQNIESFSEELVLKGILKRPFYFTWWARLTGKAQQLKVGEYELSTIMRPYDVLNLITSGRTIQYSFTIIEGWSFSQLRAALNANSNVTHETQNLTDTALMQKLGLETIHPEGRFLPDTYFFPKKYTDEQILKRSFNAMNQVTDATWEARDPALLLKSKEELLILASIIEKETGVTWERPQIAGVFIRRLEKKMRLQTDPTVIYGLEGNYKGTITRAHLLTDTPYNTYTREGLPPTPIAMPSRAAIVAAANPQKGDSLYFVAKGDGSGEHIFSATLEAHNKAVQSYRRTRE